jgi:hypothetical protein
MRSILRIDLESLPSLVTDGAIDRKAQGSEELSMVTPPQILAYIKAQPFRPFRVHMASGKTYDVRHPEMLKVGKSFLLVFRFDIGEPDVVEHWETLSLLLIESISHLDLPVNS